MSGAAPPRPADRAVREAVIAMLYRLVLQRPADAGGLAHHVALTEGDALPALLARMRAILATSDEYATRIGPRRLDLVPWVLTGTESYADRSAVPTVLSLGCNCLVASMLRAFGLRRASYPFDWCFGAPGMTLHCLEDDFATFLDPRHHVSITARRASGEPGADHAAYRDRHGVGDCFAHRDVTLPGGHAYLERGVARFRDLARQDGPVHCVMMARAHQPIAPHFQALCARLTARIPAARLLAVQIAPVAPLPPERRVEPMATAGPHRLLRLTPAGTEAGLFFHDPLDQAAALFAILQWVLGDAAA